MPLNKFIPLSPDPYITSDPEMTVAKFGHLNTIVDYLNGTNALTNIKIAGINNTAGYIDFSANPTGSTTVVGAIRTYQDGTNLLPTLQFIESGDIYQNKYSGLINNIYFQDNAGVNMPNGTGVYQGDYAGRRNGATSTIFREAVTYNGNGTTRRGRYSMGVAEDSGFGAYQFVCTQYNNIKVNILGHAAGSYIDDAVSPTTAYNIHAGNIINTTSGVLPLLSLDVNGLTKHVFQTNGNVSLNNTSDMAAILGIKGSGSTSATTSLLVQNSAGTELLKVQDDGTTTIRQHIRFLSQGIKINGSGGGVGGLSLSGADPINNRIEGTAGLTLVSSSTFSLTTGAAMNLVVAEVVSTSGDIANFEFIGIPNMQSGNATFTHLKLTPNFLTGGTYSGIARGIYYVPSGTLTGVTAHYAWQNTSGAMIVNSATPQASAVLQADSTTQGFLPPRVTTLQKNLIATPATGLQVHDTDLNRPCFYNGASWVTL
jgi:hypothetical protein